jgi:hypothetical protein
MDFLGHSNRRAERELSLTKDLFQKHDGLGVDAELLLHHNLKEESRKLERAWDLLISYLKWSAP